MFGGDFPSTIADGDFPAVCWCWNNFLDITSHRLGSKLGLMLMNARSSWGGDRNENSPCDDLENKTNRRLFFPTTTFSISSQTHLAIFKPFMNSSLRNFCQKSIQMESKNFANKKMIASGTGKWIFSPFDWQQFRFSWQSERKAFSNYFR